MTIDTRQNVCGSKPATPEWLNAKIIIIKPKTKMFITTKKF